CAPRPGAAPRAARASPRRSRGSSLAPWGAGGYPAPAARRSVVGGLEDRVARPADHELAGDRSGALEAEVLDALVHERGRLARRPAQALLVLEDRPGADLAVVGAYH